MRRNKENINKLLFDKFVFYGLHLGGLKSFWNPKMKPYIVNFRNNFCILNLSLTHRNMKQCFSYLSKIILSNRKILFVGSPKGLEKKFSNLCQTYDHHFINVYTDGFFSNFQSNKIINSPPSLIFFFDASLKEKVKKEILNLNIPIMAFVNSEDDISNVDYPIPANVNSWKGGIFVFNLFYHLFSFPEKFR